MKHVLFESSYAAFDGIEEVDDGKSSIAQRMARNAPVYVGVICSLSS